MIPEIEFATESAAICDDLALERVRRAAEASPRARARLCLHPSAEDQLHEMIIVLRRGTNIPIHRHADKAECYHVISGLLTLKICDNAGQVVKTLQLGPAGSGRAFVCRIGPGQWHTLEIESDDAAVHESTVGPFRAEMTEYLV